MDIETVLAIFSDQVALQNKLSVRLARSRPVVASTMLRLLLHLSTLFEGVCLQLAKGWLSPGNRHYSIDVGVSSNKIIK